jgi:hypothetical protein
MNTPQMPEGVYRRAAIETPGRRAFLSKTLGVTAGLVGAAAVAGAYAVPASAKEPKLRAQRRAVILVHFATFHCWKTNDSGTDDCSLKFDGIEFTRRNMRRGSAINLDLHLVVSKPEMRLWLLEHDTSSGDDVLGTHTIRQDEVGLGWRRAHFQSDAGYYLDYEVWRC